MCEVTMSELQQLLLDGRKAKQYALEHYDELAYRKHTYTLYGPLAYFLGACIPSNTMTPRRARKLLHKTRRKDYVIYHLDEDYQVMRNIIILDYTKVSAIYHHFELDGVIYAYSVPGTMKDGVVYPCSLSSEMRITLDNNVQFIRYTNGKPVSYGILSDHMVFVQFYKYVNCERVFVSTYQYWPHLKHSIWGYPIDPAAPIGALNSSVYQQFDEEPLEDTDFSRWFK